MNMFPLVSIITPCYNGEEYLYEYFDSILNQTYSNIELIFVNDGSTDRTDSIAKSYISVFEKKKIRYIYIYQQNGGQANAINTGLKRVTGKYLIWPDSDDILEKDSIEKRVIFLENNPEYSIVRSNGDFFDYKTKERLYRISNLENRFNKDIFLDLILEETFCYCGCYMIETQVLKEIYPNLTIYESSAGQNWQILIPIAGKYLCGFIDEDLYHIAVRPNSHSRQQRTLDEMIKRYLELKKILEIGVSLSGRKDRDYQYIIDLKYLKIFFRTYVKYDDYENARKCYEKLKNLNEVENIDYRLFLEKYYPVKYKIYLFNNLIGRVWRKMKRLWVEKFRKKKNVN